jgi:MSHA pilin protein MshD
MMRIRGMALIEAVVAIAIVAIAASAIMASISQANGQSARVLVQAETAAIANAYLQEIVARPWVDPDGVDGETQRRLFDDVDDYRGLVDVGARDALGTLLPGGARFAVQVGLANSNALPGVAAADAVRITVRVTDPVGGTTLATGYRLRP